MPFVRGQAIGWIPCALRQRNTRSRLRTQCCRGWQSDIVEGDLKMLFKRMAHAFLLGAGLSVVGTGCSAVDALVSSPAGRGANDTTPERLVAIARVFENQGHLQRANVMYRQALKADPGNDFVKERIEFIASINSNRRFDPKKSDVATATAIAAADAIQQKTRDVDAEPAIVTATALSADESEIKTALNEALSNTSVMDSLQPVEARIEPSPELAVVSPSNEEYAEPLIQPARHAEPVVEQQPDVVELGWDLAASDSVPAEQNEVVPMLDLHEAPTDNQAVDTISFEGSNTGRVELASQWRASRPAVVTLDQVADWMANPVENRDNLLRGLALGEDTGVKALAATMLAECPVADEEVNAALIDAFADDSELLRLAAGDALIQRGAITDGCVDELIALLASPDPEIRIQAAASLRNCAGTEWAARCVHGLAQMLDQSNEDVVIVAAATLGDFGSDAQSYTQQLETLSAGPDVRVAKASGNALNRINESLTQGR